MTRSAILIVIALGALLAACSSAAQPGGTGTPAGVPTAAGGGGGGTAAASPAGGGGGGGTGGGTSLVEAAKAVQHACTLLPADLAAAMVPDASGAPVEEQFPTRCSVYGAKTAMEFTIAPFDTGGRQAPADAKAIPGLGAGAWIQNLAPGNFYLTVLLAPDAGSLYAEVNNQDGEDHTDQVVDLAKAVLAKLGG